MSTCRESSIAASAIALLVRVPLIVSQLLNDEIRHPWNVIGIIAEQKRSLVPLASETK
jgi:hypothetical protein